MAFNPFSSFAKGQGAGFLPTPVKPVPKLLGGVFRILDSGNGPANPRSRMATFRLESNGTRRSG